MAQGTGGGPGAGHPWARAALAVVALGAGALLAGCRGDGGERLVEVTVPPGGPGVCLDVPLDAGAEVEDLPRVDCARPHSHEVYADERYQPPPDEPPDVYPGLEALEDFARRTCVIRFEDFVGVSAFDSPDLTYSWIVPTLGSWEDHDDRTVLCVLSRADGAPMTGSLWRDSSS